MEADGKPLVAKTTAKNHFRKLTKTQRARIILDLNNLEENVKESIYKKIGRVDPSTVRSKKKRPMQNYHHICTALAAITLE